MWGAGTVVHVGEMRNAVKRFGRKTWKERDHLGEVILKWILK
jgi:hypothetical protein